ncbi:ATP-grasp domain-containing protein [Pelagibius marinus]|uniref:ATP-grasp domain-containing protein n=1 Tax=Pelagibius marinus TaxID=2762760 RepID=UPI0029CA7714|nr:ATP-grasp domain-containing protein [Pelagibius marinus]
MDGPAENILITSAARKAPLVRAMKSAATRAVPGAAVIAGDIDPQAPARYVADGFWQMPRLTEATPQTLLEGCRERGIGTVLPTRDGELAFWADARAPFAEAGIDVIVSAPESVERCLDKLAFARFGAAQSLPFISASTDLDELEGETFVVKERFGAGSRSIGIDLPRAAALDHARRLEDPVFQPFEAGAEISIDAWMDCAGAPRGLVLRRRDRVVGGESQITTTFRDAALEAAAFEVLAALDLRGPAVMQAIVPAGGGLRVIECNCRFGGASTASIAAGLDMLYWSLAERHSPEAAPAFLRIEGELRQVRLPEDIVLHDFDL